MQKMSVLPVVVAAFAAFLLSAVWYGAFGQEMAKLHPAYADAAAASRPPAWKMLAELIRSLILASVLARLVVSLGVSDWRGAALLGVLLWVGFPVVLWAGAILWENVPPKLAAIHAGDWLAKLVLIAVVVGVWRR
jgi:hypothetical protein